MSLPHLLLGLLSFEPQSGYDLNKRFDATVNNFWTTDQSQIYRALYKLLDKEQVRVETVIQEGQPDKKVYHLTDAGKAALDQWLAKPIKSKGATVRQGWLGQLFFGERIPPEELRDVLQTYKRQAQVFIDSLDFIRNQYFADKSKLSYGARLRLLTIEYGIQVNQAAVEWYDTAIAVVEDEI
jgi:PadR family transcriptional regulator, regulatory protein AphA